MTVCGGASLDEMLRQQETGRVRHIGFTGHRSPGALSHMLARTSAMVTCQMPINVLDPSYESFLEGVMPRLVKGEVGVLAMKSLANGRLFSGDAPVIPDRISLRDALCFAWSMPVSVLVYGPDDRYQLREALQIARTFEGLDANSRQALITRVADLAGRRLEYYKA